MTSQIWIESPPTLSASANRDGMTVKRSTDGNVTISIPHPRITLRGLEYLQENSAMQKAARLAKGIAEIVT